MDTNSRKQMQMFLVAVGEKGIAEIPGPKSNDRIIEYDSCTTLRATSDEIPWCSAFINWCAKKAGAKGTGSALARSWLVWGIDVTNQPMQGDLVILERGNDGISGHVGFLAETPSVINPWIKVLGGNQNNMVCIESFSKLKVLGYRRAIDSIET